MFPDEIIVKPFSAKRSPPQGETGIAAHVIQFTRGGLAFDYQLVRHLLFAGRWS